MKKFLSLVLVLVLMMSVAVIASAEGPLPGTGTDAVLPEAGALPSIGEMFDAVSDFLKLEAFMPYVESFHTAMSDFYVQFDLWLRALGGVINGVLGGIFA